MDIYHILHVIKVPIFIDRSCVKALTTCAKVVNFHQTTLVKTYAFQLIHYCHINLSFLVCDVYNL